VQLPSSARMRSVAARSRWAKAFPESFPKPPVGSLVRLPSVMMKRDMMCSLLWGGWLTPGVVKYHSTYVRAQVIDLDLRFLPIARCDQCRYLWPRCR